MNNIKLLSIITVMFLIFQGIQAQDQQLVPKFERVTDLEEYSLKISFHSWDEETTTQLNLDQYFPVKRNPNSRYVYLAPPEISVEIDQDNGVANLKAFKDWTGTKEIIFSLTNVFNLGSAISDLQKYKETITQKRVPLKLKEQFEELPAFHLFEKILDNMESQVQPSVVEVTKLGNKVKVSVGKEVKLELDLITKTQDNKKTLKPRVDIEIHPEEKIEEEIEEETGLSFFIFFPLILIVIVLLVLGIIYIKRNKERFKKHFKKKKIKQTTYDKLLENKKQLTQIQNKLRKQEIEKSVSEVFAIIKEVFNALTPVEYQFSYSEISKNQLKKALSKKLKQKLCRFSKDISDIRFSGEKVKRQQLNKIIKQAQDLVEKSAREERYITFQKEKEELSQTLTVKIIKYIIDSFKDEPLTAKKKKKEYLIRTKPIFHKLNILKAIIKKELEKRREQKRKARSDKLKFLTKKKRDEVKREMKKKEKKEREKELKKLQGRIKLKEFLHNKFRLFKTKEEIEESRIAKKLHRIEVKHKIEDTVLKALASRLERKKLTPEQEIKILMQVEEEAIKHGDTKASRDIQKRINRMYKKIRKTKQSRFSKFKTNLATQSKVISSALKFLSLYSLYSPIKRINTRIKESLTPKIENVKIDQINYLINNAEAGIRRSRNQEAKEFYHRAVSLYRSMNRPSKRMALPSLLRIKNEITSTAISDSLEKAFNAIYTGQITKAEKLYQNIDVNFLNLPTAEREKVYDKKEQLYQKIREQKRPARTKQVSATQIMRKLFTKKKKHTIFPLADEENKFRPKPKQEAKVETKAKQETKKESLRDFILAKRPKFPSIKTEIKNKRYQQTLTNKLLQHIRKAEHHLSKKDHKKAHHNYKLAIDIFKDVHLKPEVRDNVYRNLSDIKERIIHTSLHNFFRKTKEYIKKERTEEAKKFHKTLEGIYNHIHMKKEKEISQLIKKQSMKSTLPESLYLERKLNQLSSAIRQNKIEEALSLYNQVYNHYNNLRPKEKEDVYPRLINLYSELMKIQRR